MQIPYRHDPIGPASSGAPHDEYEPEVGTIIPLLRSADSVEDVTRIVTKSSAAGSALNLLQGRKRLTRPSETKFSASDDAI